MPWILDRNGEQQYKPSIYTKEELPTWVEVYEEFYKNKKFTFHHEKDQNCPVDPYWKIPRLKYLLPVVCNQFNKMLFEDGYKNTLIKRLAERKVLVHGDESFIHDIRFSCTVYTSENMEWFFKSIYLGLNSAPPIYTIPLPTGNENPFISKYTRVNVMDLDCLFFRPILEVSPRITDRHHLVLYEPYPNDDTSHDFFAILDAMMDPFKEYFEGEAPGWKDENGNLLEKEEGPRKCTGAGFDPAL